MATVLHLRNSRDVFIHFKLEVDLKTTTLAALRELVLKTVKITSLEGYKLALVSYLTDARSLDEEKENSTLAQLEIPANSCVFYTPPPDPSKQVRRRKKKAEPEIEIETDDLDSFSMDVDDVISTLERTKDAKKRKAILYFGCKKAKELTESKSWGSISKESLLAFIGHDRFALEEGTIFDLALKWAKKKAGKDDAESVKKVFLPEIFPLIRFPLMTTADIATKVVPAGILEMQQTLDLFSYTGALSALKDKSKDQDVKGPPLGKSIEKMNTKKRAPIRIEFDWAPYSSVSINARRVTANTSACHIVTANTILSKGKHEWKVRVLQNGSYISIGVVGPSISRTQGYIGNSADGWSLNEDGRTEHQGSYNYDTRGTNTALTIGDVIDVTLDMDKKQLSFRNDKGISWSPMTITLPEVYPAVMVYGSTSVELFFT